jgi:hypothetical protein
MGWASTLLTASLGIACIAAPVVMLTSPQWPGHFQKVVHAAVLLWLSLLAAGFAIREVGLTFQRTAGFARLPTERHNVRRAGK